MSNYSDYNPPIASDAALDLTESRNSDSQRNHQLTPVFYRPPGSATLYNQQSRLIPSPPSRYSGETFNSLFEDLPSQSHQSGPWSDRPPRRVGDEGTDFSSAPPLTRDPQQFDPYSAPLPSSSHAVQPIGRPPSLPLARSPQSAWESGQRPIYRQLTTHERKLKRSGQFRSITDRTQIAVSKHNRYGASSLSSQSILRSDLSSVYRQVSRYEYPSTSSMQPLSIDDRAQMPTPILDQAPFISRQPLSIVGRALMPTPVLDQAPLISRQPLSIVDRALMPTPILEQAPSIFRQPLSIVDRALMPPPTLDQAPGVSRQPLSIVDRALIPTPILEKAPSISRKVQQNRNPPNAPIRSQKPEAHVHRLMRVKPAPADQRSLAGSQPKTGTVDSQQPMTRSLRDQVTMGAKWHPYPKKDEPHDVVPPKDPYTTIDIHFLADGDQPFDEFPITFHYVIYRELPTDMTVRSLISKLRLRYVFMKGITEMFKHGDRSHVRWGAGVTILEDDQLANYSLTELGWGSEGKVIWVAMKEQEGFIWNKDGVLRERNSRDSDISGLWWERYLGGT